MEAFRGPPGGLLGASWRLLGASSGLLGAFWGLLWGFLGPPGGVWGPKARNVTFVPPSGPALGAVLGPSWAVFGASWVVLGLVGPSWSSLGGLWGRLGATLGDSWAVFDAMKAQEAIMSNMYIFQGMGQFWRLRAFLGALLKASWGVLERSGAVWRRSWASWTDRSTTRGSLGPSWGPLGVFLGWLGLPEPEKAPIPFQKVTKERPPPPPYPGRATPACTPQQS